MTELSSLYQYHYISDSHKMRKGLDMPKHALHNSLFLHADSIIFSHYRIGKERHCVLQHSFLPATFMHHQKSTYPQNGGSYA